MYPRPGPGILPSKDTLCTEVIGECIHNSYEGWSDGEKVVIELFLMDLGIATNLTLQSYQKERDDS